MKMVNGYNKLQQYILRKKYERAKSIYIICNWAKWGVLEAKWTGKIDKHGNPLTIHYTDCNGTRDYYYITEWFHESTGASIYGYFFNKEEADLVAMVLNKERNKNGN